MPVPGEKDRSYQEKIVSDLSHKPGKIGLIWIVLVPLLLILARRLENSTTYREICESFFISGQFPARF